MHLKCCYSSCKSDSRKSEPGIKFMPFPKPNKLPNISRRWVHLCARTEFTVASINKYTYICSNHFPPGELLNIRSNPKLEPYDARNIQNVTSNSHILSYLHCNECEYKTKDKSNLKQHLRAVHRMGNMIQCGECDYEAGSKRSYETHMLRFHKKGKCLKCNDCEFTSSHLYHLKRHIRVSHRNGKIFKCEYCEYQTHTRREMKIHMKVMHGKREYFQCEYCEFRTHNQSKMKVHTNKAHRKNHMFKCEECEFKSFNMLYKVTLKMCIILFKITTLLLI